MSYNPTGSQSPQKIPGYNQSSVQQFTPEQMQLFQQMFSQVNPQSYTSRLAGGDPSMFNELEAPAFRQFGELQGNLASRFSGMGTGARRSSGFQTAMGGASSDLARNLAAQRMGLQRQAISDLMNMSNTLLSQRPYEQVLTRQQRPFWQELLMGMSPGVGQGLSSLAGFGLDNFFRQGQGV